MFKMNLRKMVLTTVAAAFVACAPAMAEEDIILDETFAAEAAVPGAEAESGEQVGLVEIETVDAVEIPKEVAQAAAGMETEFNAVETTVKSFFFENDEVVIKAAAKKELPENVKMQVLKLEEGSAEFEAAKAAAENSCGADARAEYKFYTVAFLLDGAEIELADDEMYLEVEFKTIKVDHSMQSQSVLHIDETEVEDVTAQTEQGSNMSSVKFAL